MRQEGARDGGTKEKREEERAIKSDKGKGEKEEEGNTEVENNS